VIRILEYVAWFMLVGALVAVLIHGGYTSTTRIIQGTALAATGVLLVLRTITTRRQARRRRSDRQA
jgi:hypothetical protein